jgi:hypothetical protein
MNRSVCRVMVSGHHGAGRVGHCAAAQGISAVRPTSSAAAPASSSAARECITSLFYGKRQRH